MHIQDVAQALQHFFSRVGFPHEILNDKGQTLTPTLLKQLCELLGICQLFMTIYYPQTDGLGKQINQMFEEHLR